MTFSKRRGEGLFHTLGASSDRSDNSALTIAQAPQHLLALLASRLGNTRHAIA
jgi:hypothetical protein